ncbi:MAG: hypothetical protein ACPGQL_09025 [Thermoplasmatota archaeon]
MSQAWACYLPFPFVRTSLIWSAPADRLVRFHAWQARVLFGLGLLGLLAFGGLLSLSDASGYRAVMAFPTLLVLLGLVGGTIAGLVGAMGGRFTRLPGAWHVARLLHASFARRG